MTIRLILTAIIVVLSGWLSTIWESISTLALGSAAGLQFDSSNTSYLVANSVFGFIHSLGGFIWLVPIILLILVWWSYITNILMEAK